MKPKSYCFIVVRKVPYEGNHVRAVFSDEQDAESFRDKLQEKNDMKGSWDYAVEEWELQ